MLGSTLVSYLDFNKIKLNLSFFTVYANMFQTGCVLLRHFAHEKNAYIVLRERRKLF